MLRPPFGIIGLFELIFDLFGWPGVGVLVVLILVGLWALYQHGGHMFQWLLFRNFRAHGKVLKGAQVQVHSVTAAPEPAKDADDEEFEAMMEEADLPDDNGEEMRYYYVDATITPTQDPKSLEHPEDGWDPCLLMLMEAGRKDVELMEMDGSAFVQDAWLIQGPQLVPIAGKTCHGPARIKLHIAARPDCRRLQFLYMQELFGDIVIPEIPVPASPKA